MVEAAAMADSAISSWRRRRRGGASCWNAGPGAGGRARRRRRDAPPRRAPGRLRPARRRRQVRRGRRRRRGRGRRPRAAPCVGADTIVIADDEILGKPADEDDARRMLGRAGRAAPRRHHRVPDPLRRQDARPRGHDRGLVSLAAARRARRLHRVRRVAGQGRRLRGPGDRAARSSPSCAARTPTSSGCRWPSCSPTCRRWRRCRAIRRPASAAAADDGRAPQEIADSLARVRERIARGRARRRAVRAGSVRLLAVSKKMPADDVRAALAAGQRAFGENYAQELRDKLALLADDATLPAPPEWHFIGPLQSNKVKYVAGRVALLHSVDSAALLDAIEARGGQPGLPGPGQRRRRAAEARRRARRICRRCSTASRP